MQKCSIFETRSDLFCIQNNYQTFVNIALISFKRQIFDLHIFIKSKLRIIRNQIPACYLEELSELNKHFYVKLK